MLDSLPHATPGFRLPRSQRLRIAGSNGDSIFENDAVTAIFRYSQGIPRVINLLCEHCLVSGFVDQRKIVTVEVVDSVARDFDLTEGNAAAAMIPAAPVSSERFDLVEALRTLATLADRLRHPEQPDVPKEGKI